MRLKGYITEQIISKNVRELADLLRNECKPFINEWRGAKNFLIRVDERMEGSNRPLFVKRSIRKDRIPTDMPKEFSVYMDNKLKEKFGWYPRSEGLFCYLNPYSTSEYKHMKYQTYGPNFIFPVGQYKYVYATKLSDIYIKTNHWIRMSEFDIKSLEDFRSTPRYSQKQRDEVFNKFKEYFEENYLSQYTDKNAPNAQIKRVELSISAKSAYMVHPAFMGEISIELGLNWKTIEKSLELV